MKKYGLPYQGSKSKLADRILPCLPSADCFVDLFAGGMAITHAALLSGRYGRVIANDVSDIPQVFVNAARGMYDNEDRWISRDDFYRLRDSDPFVRLVWSFSNNLCDYIYSRDLEPFKRALHWAVCFRDPKPLEGFGIDVKPAIGIKDRYRRYLAVKHICGDRRWTAILPPEQRKHLQSYTTAECLAYLGGGSARERIDLENFQRANCLPQQSGQCGRLDVSSLTILRGDYRDVKIPGDSVVYCDPPYRNTRHYDKRGSAPFDYDAYYEWLRTRPFPVWCSEYTMPDDFVCIAQFRHRATNSGTKGAENIAVIERLFLHEKWAERRVRNGLFD